MRYLQAKLYPRILAAMKPGATLGLSHGFLLGVMQNDGADFREDIDVILMAPKVRALPSATLPKPAPLSMDCGQCRLLRADLKRVMKLARGVSRSVS